MPRLTADMRISALRRFAEQDGGFVTVMKRGDSTSGDILLLIAQRGEQACLFGRRMTLEGEYEWSKIEQKNTQDQSFEDYLTRASARDPDLWILEVDVADRARFVEWLPIVN